MESARAAGLEPRACWFLEVDFDPAQLELLPAQSRSKACICEACARQGATQNPKSRLKLAMTANAMRCNSGQPGRSDSPSQADSRPSSLAFRKPLVP